MNKNSKTPLERLRHHVTGAIERGEAQPIVEVTGKGKAPGVQWSKISSVMTGGAPYFFNTVTDDYYARRSVVWDRFEKAWAVKGPQTLEHHRGKVYSYFPTVGKAKQFVQDGHAI